MRKSLVTWMTMCLVIVAAAVILCRRGVGRLTKLTDQTVQPLDLKPIESCSNSGQNVTNPPSKSATNSTNLPAKSTSNTSMYSCDHPSDCWRFQKMLAEDWDPSKPKAAVYILTRTRDAGDLRRTLAELENNFLGNYSYPVIIFHERDFTPLIPSIIGCTGSNLFFQEVQFELPKFLYPSGAKAMECDQGIGYRHMCRFHAKVVYDLPIMRNLEYYLRLDAHSYITKPVPYDLFKSMKANDLLYLYPCVSTDILRCARFLWDAAGLFVKVKRIKPKFLNKMNNLKMYYNNFEMARMDVFTGPAYQNYINFIDYLGGIYHNRWGDAPIKSLAISIFVPEKQTRQIYDLEYFHRNIKLTRALSSPPPSNKCR